MQSRNYQVEFNAKEDKAAEEREAMSEQWSAKDGDD